MPLFRSLYAWGAEMKSAAGSDPLWVKALVVVGGGILGLLAAIAIWFVRDWWTHYGPWAS